MMKNKILGLITGLSLLTFLFLLPTFTSFETGVVSAEKAPNIQSHCVNNVAIDDGKLEQGNITNDKKTDEECFKTQSEALSLISNSSIVGIAYDNTFYTGSSWVFTTSHIPGCSDGTTFAKNATASTWGNRLESHQGYTGCNNRTHYQFFTYSGPSYNCGAYCDTLYALNNKVNSIRWAP